ncbi:MAG: TIR domain-containing protein [Pseudomonadota bacterium]
MADVFISYSRRDRDRIAELARLLTERGLSVFWDRQIDTGAEFSKTIEREITAAGKVLVAWSADSVESQWVRDEAALAQEQDKLFPISLDGTPAPLGFRQYQTLDLASWKGERGAEVINALVDRVKPPSATAERPPAQPPRSARSWVPFAVVAVVAAGIAAAWFGLKQTEPPAAEITTVEEQSVGLAILPFASLSEDNNDELFADGLSEELLNRMSAIAGLKVPGRTSAFRFKARTEPPEAIGAALNVDYLVEGTVRRSGDSLRITSSLIEAATGFTKWTQTFDREMSDLFAIQDDIAGAVVSELLGALRYDEVARAGPVSASPTAHAHYLEGRALWSKRDQAAAERFELALELDPDHALALAYLAIVRTYRERQLTPRISELLNQASELLPDDPDVLFAQGWVLELSQSRDTKAIAEKYQRALRANPRSVEALYATFRLTQNPALLEAALEIDPAHIPARTTLVRQYYIEGNQVDASRMVNQAFVTYPEFSVALMAAPARDFGDVNTLQRLLFSDLERSRRNAWARSGLASMLAGLGAEEEARIILELGPTAFDRMNRALLLSDWDTYLSLVDDPEIPAVFRPFVRALGLREAGRPEEALDGLQERWPEVFFTEPVLENGRLANPGDWVATLGVQLLNDLGQTEQAAVLAEAVLQLVARDELGRTMWPYDIHVAVANAQLGRADQTAEALARAVERGFRYPYGYGCEACLWPSFTDSGGYLSRVINDPKVLAALATLREANAETLAQIETRFEALTKIRALKPAAAPVP